MLRPTGASSTRALVLLLAAVGGLAAAGAGGGETAPALRGEAAGLRAHADALARNEHGALLDLYALESRLGSAQTRLAALRRQADGVRRARATVHLELGVARRSLGLAERRIASQLRLLYEDGASASVVEILLGAKSLDDALSRLDDLDRTTSQNRSVASQVRAARGQLLGLQRLLARRQSRADALAAAAAATTASLERARAERASYLARLRAERDLTERQVVSLEERARSAEERARIVQAHVAEAPPLDVAPAPAPLPDPAPAETAAAPPVAAGGGALAVSSTGYSLPGTTATGVPVGWGVAAVDPSVIPLGTRLYVPGYGVAVAADTGPAVQGAEIDLWFPSDAQALAWGRRAITVTVAA